MGTDANGNVAAITDGANVGQGNRTMTYDGLDRLKSAVSPMFGNASYSYDALDNMTHLAIGGSAAWDHHYCFDAANEYDDIVRVRVGAYYDRFRLETFIRSSLKMGPRSMFMKKT